MIDRETGYLERFLDILSERQRVLSSNIANADTPGYRAMDLNFRDEFRKAIEQHKHGDAVEPQSLGTSLPSLFETPSVSPNRDGNTVSMDIEMAKMAENTLLYSIMTQFAGLKIRMVRDAIVNSK